MITVFTPTYNRKNELINLYNSLLNQDFKDFEWIIVDDGSTDDTESLIKELQKENKVKIIYYKQENRGKSYAHNRGVELAKGEFFVGIDSDCMFVDDSLKKINFYFQKIKNDDNICGISFLNYKKGSSEVIGSKFPKDEMTDTYYDIYHKDKVVGDKEMVFKTEILKKYKFPIYENEKFVPEAMLFNRICKDYKFLCVNQAVIFVDYLQDGYSSNYINLAKKNPQAHRDYYKELFELEPSNYNVAAYNMYSIYAKDGPLKTIKSHPSRFKSLILYIPAYIKFLQKELNK